MTCFSSYMFEAEFVIFISLKVPSGYHYFLESNFSKCIGGVRPDDDDDGFLWKTVYLTRNLFQFPPKKPHQILH